MSIIGFIGLGHMGLPMAINLVKAGHQVTGYDLDRVACQDFAQAGGKVASSLAEVVSRQDVVLTMLQQGQQVLDVCTAPDGLFELARPGTLYIDCSTIDVHTSRLVHEQGQAKQLLVVDAPVSGGVAGAKAASLTFMLGTENPKVLEQATAILSVMGQKIIPTGGPGSGQAAKICNNMVLGISMIAISEAFVLAKQVGLSDAKLFEVINNASGQCWAMSKYAPVPGLLDNVPANQDYKPGFASLMMLKDLRLSQEVAQAVGVETPLGAKAKSLYQSFIDSGHGDLDFSAIIQSIMPIKGN